MRDGAPEGCPGGPYHEVRDGAPEGCPGGLYHEVLDGAKGGLPRRAMMLDEARVDRSGIVELTGSVREGEGMRRALAIGNRGASGLDAARERT